MSCSMDVSGLIKLKFTAKRLSPFVLTVRQSMSWWMWLTWFKQHIQAHVLTVRQSTSR